MKGENFSNQIWRELIANAPLGGLGVERTEGRMDLRNMRQPDFGSLLDSDSKFRNVAGPVVWANLDFTGSSLKGLRLRDSKIINCIFDDCDMSDFRLWASTVSECSFKNTNLAGSALGAVDSLSPTPNSYLSVDFSGANLSRSIYKAASFDNCVFRKGNLTGIDFQTTAFSNCVFEGELRDVIFYSKSPSAIDFPENTMKNVDFSLASLHDVGFRGLTLENVVFPENKSHIVIKNFPSVLPALIKALSASGDKAAGKVLAYMNIDKKWIAPKRTQSVINLDDLAEVAGPEGVALLRAALTHLQS